LRGRGADPTARNVKGGFVSEGETLKLAEKFAIRGRKG